MGRALGTTARRAAGLPLTVLASATALAAVVAVSLAVGSSSVGAGEVWAYLTGGGLTATERSIIATVRIPRAAAALLAGAALAAAGALVQAVLDNPLASPSIIGVNSGAGFFVLLASAVPALAAEANPQVLPLAAFAGALAASAIILLVSARTGVSRLTVVLAGVALNAVFTAGANTVLIVAPNAYVGSSTYLVGGFSGVLLSDLAAPALICLFAFVAALVLAPHLNVLSLGADQAHALGMRVGAVRAAALATAALLASAAVSYAGLLGFVGLVVPHVVRRFVGADNRRVIPVCALWGAAFTLACDTVARTAFSPYELPVGILLAFVGGPFFVFLLMRGRGFRDE